MRDGRGWPDLNCTYQDADVVDQLNYTNVSHVHLELQKGFNRLSFSSLKCRDSKAERKCFVSVSACVSYFPVGLFFDVCFCPEFETETRLP